MAFGAKYDLVKINEERRKKRLRMLTHTEAQRIVNENRVSRHHTDDISFFLMTHSDPVAPASYRNDDPSPSYSTGDDTSSSYTPSSTSDSGSSYSSSDTGSASSGGMD